MKPIRVINLETGQFEEFLVTEKKLGECIECDNVH